MRRIAIAAVEIKTALPRANSAPMLAVASRPQDAPPGARQYDRRDGQEREQRAPERDLAQRIVASCHFTTALPPANIAAEPTM